MKKTILFSIIIIIFCNLIVFPQNKKIDSLWQVLKKIKQDTSLTKLYIELGKEYENTSSDTALFYYDKALTLAKKIKNKKWEAKSLYNKGSVLLNIGEYDNALEYFQNTLMINKAFSLSTNKPLSIVGLQGICDCLNGMGLVYFRQGNYSQALEYHQKSLKICKEIGDKKGMSNGYTNIGNVHYTQGNYDKAIEYFLKSLNIFEESGNSPDIIIVTASKKGMAQSYNNIGAVLMCQGSYDKAIDYYLKSLKIKEELGDEKGISVCFTNIGNVYYAQGSSTSSKKFTKDKYDKAIEYFLKSLKIYEDLDTLNEVRGEQSRTIERKKGISHCYNNIGNVLSDMGNYDKAIEYYLKSLKIKEKLGDKNGIALVYGNISSLHITLADSVAITPAEKNAHYNEAINYGLKSLKLAKEINTMPWINSAASFLQKAYKALGNTAKSLEYAEIFIDTKDSMFKKEKIKIIAEIETKYQTEKKEQQISLLEKDNQLHIALLNKQQIRTLLAIIVAGLLIICLILLYLYSKVKQKNKLNQEQIKHKMEQLKAVVETQEKERERFARDIHDGIGQYFSALKMNLSKLEDNKYFIDEKTIYNSSMQLIDELHQEVRNISFDIMPKVITIKGLAVALNELALKINSIGKILITINSYDFHYRFPITTEIAIYRIIQEIVNNILKHSNANEVNIQFTQHEQELNIIVEDNGIGYNSSILVLSFGHGWKNIFSRIEMIGGTIDIDSTPDKTGTTIIINVPITA